MYWDIENLGPTWIQIWKELESLRQIKNIQDTLVKWLSVFSLDWISKDYSNKIEWLYTALNMYISWNIDFEFFVELLWDFKQEHKDTLTYKSHYEKKYNIDHLVFDKNIENQILQIDELFLEIYTYKWHISWLLYLVWKFYMLVHGEREDRVNFNNYALQILQQDSSLMIDLNVID